MCAESAALIDELRELRADLDDARRRLAPLLDRLTVLVLSPHADRAMVRRVVLEALGLTQGLLGAHDAIGATLPRAYLAEVDGWRIVVARAAPAIYATTRALTEAELYSIILAVQLLDFADDTSAGEAVRDALPDDVAEVLEHLLAVQVGMDAPHLWCTLGANMRDTARLIRVPERA